MPKDKPSPLKEADFVELYRMIEAPVTAFDCGRLCAPQNDGVPFCCDREQMLPVLWKTELKWQQRWSDFWEAREPEDAHERQVLKAMRSCFVVGECPGPADCEREKRSISCRTFPFEPYLGYQGELLGLVFDHRFRKQCPLVGEERFDDVTPKYVRQALAFWERLLDLDPEERAAYCDTSEQKRRSFGQRHRTIPVITLKGLRQFPTKRSRPPRAMRV